MEENLIYPEKIKLLTVGDMPIMAGGVSLQSRFLFEGLLKTGRYEIVSLGAAIKHQSYQPLLNTNFKHPWKIFPIDGFFNKDLFYEIMDVWTPEVIFIVSDPRFYYDFFSETDSFIYRAPLVWWAIWDSVSSMKAFDTAPDMVPDFNRYFYSCCDFIGAITKETLRGLRAMGYNEDKAQYISHCIPEEYYFKEKDMNKVAEWRKNFLGGQDTEFLLGFNSRNARRKMLGLMLDAYKRFITKNRLTPRDTMFLLKCSPVDPEGPALLPMLDKLGLQGYIKILDQQLSFGDMNTMYNAIDLLVLLSSAEGHGLAITESSFTKTPSLISYVGGLKYQAKNDNNEDIMYYCMPKAETLIGSQAVPFIYDFYCSPDDVAEKMEYIYDLKKNNPVELEKMGQKAMEYHKKEYNVANTISKWDFALQRTVKNFKENKPKAYVLSKI